MSEHDYCLEKIRRALREKGFSCSFSETFSLWEVKPLGGMYGPFQHFDSLGQLKEKYLLRPEKIYKNECFCLEILDSQADTHDLHHFKTFSEAFTEKELFERLYGQKIVANIFRVNEKGAFSILNPERANLKIVNSASVS
ncbi:MAG: hypothetical protein AB8G05_11245 [Oligoflexales bacterium]